MSDSSTEVIEILEAIVNAKRQYRDQARDAVLSRPELLPSLIDLVFAEQDRLSIKAAWTLELVALEELDLLFPYLGRLLPRVEVLKEESSLRPLAKISFLLTQAHFHAFPSDEKLFKGKDQASGHLKRQIPVKLHEPLISALFLWLQGPHKVAPKVFAMDALAAWSRTYPWIADQLVPILQEAYPKESPGYQARARKILLKI